MPYVKQHKRHELDVVIDAMRNVYVTHNGHESLKVDGDLNYILFAYCKRHIKPSYINYKNFCAELNECVVEIRRKLLAPLEDKKIIENGDVK